MTISQGILGPETIEKGKFLIADVKDCFNLDEIHPYVILDGRKPEESKYKNDCYKKIYKRRLFY